MSSVVSPFFPNRQQIFASVADKDKKTSRAVGDLRVSLPVPAAPMDATVGEMHQNNAIGNI